MLVCLAGCWSGLVWVCPSLLFWRATAIKQLISLVRLSYLSPMQISSGFFFCIYMVTKFSTFYTKLCTQITFNCWGLLLILLSNSLLPVVRLTVIKVSLQFHLSLSTQRCWSVFPCMKSVSRLVIGRSHCLCDWHLRWPMLCFLSFLSLLAYVCPCFF